MEELVEKLKSKHGFSNEVAKNVIATFVEFIQETSPTVLPLLSNLTERKTSVPYNAEEQSSSSPAAQYIPDAVLKTDQQMSKDKQSGFYEGNKRDY